MPSECEAKGANFVALLKAMKSLTGPDAEAAVRDEVTGPLRSLLTANTLNEGTWYPVAHYRELHRAAEVVAGRPVARELGRLATRELFSKAYELFARIVGPKTSWRHSTHALNAFYRPVELEVMDARDGQGRCRVRACHGFDERIWQDVIGSMEEVIVIAGGPAARATEVRLSKDFDSMEARFEWGD